MSAVGEGIMHFNICFSFAHQSVTFRRVTEDWRDISVFALADAMLQKSLYSPWCLCLCEATTKSGFLRIRANYGASAFVTPAHPEIIRHTVTFGPRLLIWAEFYHYQPLINTLEHSYQTSSNEIISNMKCFIIGFANLLANT